MFKSAALLSSLLGAASCRQLEAQDPIAAPLRELPWAQLNFLHTTDVHAWWGGHLQEASFSADWGDYVSFAKHLRDKADAEGVDLLVVDTGDRVEGNAIYDSSKPRGKFTYEIAKEQHIDLISSGNHELYKADTAEGEYYHTVRDFQGSYLASNLDIYDPETGYLEPLAPRYKKFATKNQGIRILAFGFIFDFTGNANNTVVTRVEDTVNEDWFKTALKDKDLDLVVVFGHVDIRSPEYALLFSTIRAAHPDLPIQFFGGHSHIRDYKIFDDKSVALESGRYMETLGFMSIDGLSTGSSDSRRAANTQKQKLTFSRRYIDNNLFSLRHHSGKDEKSFSTAHGLNVSKAIGDARDSLGLTKKYGCAPRDLWISRRPYPHKESILSWIEEQVLPDSIAESSRLKNGGKALVIQNTGAIRFDIFKGAFTKDTKFLVSPFTSPLRLIKDVPYKAASQVIKLLNHGGPIVMEMMEANAFLQPPEVTAARFRPSLFSSSRSADVDTGRTQKPMLAEDPALIPGYTTQDDAGSDGDDTVHSRIDFYNVPNCIQSAVGFDPAKADEEPQTVDLMYNEFIQKWILMALQFIGQRYTSDDTEVYAQGKSFTDIMTDWVSEHWAHEGECPK